MEQTQLPLCPIGIQTFSEIRMENYLYVDKTGLVYQLTHGAGKYFFLSRPRRFGKSLLTSTLRSYFEGRKELFEGLAIAGLEKEWTAYPVLHFDMSTAKHVTCEQLLQELEGKLARYEEVYGPRRPEDVNPNQRLNGLIQRAFEQTGRKVVVLIDEYDAPLLDVVHEEEMLPRLRQVMRNFYSPLKGCDPYLRFVFLTGITKFSQLSIFSELNNIKNVSMLKEYAAVCGFTEEELRTQMAGHVHELAEAQELTDEEAMQALKSMYDGYHFTWPSPDIFNPYSLLNALNDKELGSYWFGSGTPTYLIEMLRKYHVMPTQLGASMEAMEEEFDAPTERMTSIVPLLYQSGYYTIKRYDKRFQLYTLAIPNKEIRIGLLKSLLPNYVREGCVSSNVTVSHMARALYHDDMDGALRLLQQYLLTVPYCDHTDYEGHYQQLLYIIFSLLGMFVEVEVRTPRGRVDMVLRTATRLYVVELKLNATAAEAMQQIDLKQYAERFALEGLPVTKVAITFDSEQKTLGSWEIK